MNAIFQLLNPSNTVSVNRPLAHALGLNEAVVYGALISKFYYYSERAGKRDVVYIVSDFIRSHTDPVILNGNGLRVLIRGNGYAVSRTSIFTPGFKANPE